MMPNKDTKVTPDWRKRVSIEYARLRAQKKFRHQDDIKMAWNANRSTIEQKSVEEKKEDGQHAPVIKKYLKEILAQALSI